MLFSSEYLNQVEEIQVERTSKCFKFMRFTFISSIIIGFFVLFIYLTARGYLAQLLTFIEASGSLGWLVFIGIFIIFSFPIPIGSSPLVLSAGFMYGLGRGILIVSFSSTVGAIVGFWICRILLKRWVEEKIQGSRGMD